MWIRLLRGNGWEYQRRICCQRKWQSEDKSLGNLNIEKTPFWGAVPGMVFHILWMKHVLQQKRKIYKGERKNNFLASHQPKSWPGTCLFSCVQLSFSTELIINAESFPEFWGPPGFTFGFCFCDKVRVSVMLEANTGWVWGTTDILAWGRAAWSRAQSPWDQFQKDY